MSRRNYKKVTTVSKDVFGRKVIETQYVPAAGCGTIVVIVALCFLFFRGCG